ncbi:MAG: recombination mediator RecR [Bacteroidetes bacterium]|nr:recombination mediator RecR [Bacteroidota bacterium]MBU1677348.1 recombination mediator RecR [Bacteroidota bacterium]MBU2505421.1 recombination mediator RecR [Bacteroidota bacterium]
MIIPEPLQILIDELSKLPTIGRKTAQRLAIHLLKSEKQSVEQLMIALENLITKISFCARCFNISTNDLCDICKSEKRDKRTICVVEEISDVIAIEKTNEFNGVYHVLGGVLSPLSGTDAGQLKIKELLERIPRENIMEVILALNPDTEGETTSLYLAKILKSFNIEITRIARGIPIGSDIEFADEATIGRAVLSRIKL